MSEVWRAMWILVPKILNEEREKAKIEADAAHAEAMACLRKVGETGIPPARKCGLMDKLHQI